jgi:hypothetical protein
MEVGESTKENKQIKVNRIQTNQVKKEESLINKIIRHK